MRVEVKNQTEQFCEADVVPRVLFKCMEQEKDAHDGSRQLELCHLVSGALPCIATNQNLFHFCYS